MKKQIQVKVVNKIATADRTEYVCGNSDYVLSFDFDEEWSEHEYKTARFIYNGGYVDVVFSGNECPVPTISNTYHIRVGVYAGDLNTTTPAYIPAKKSILCENPPPADPMPDVYAQIMAVCNETKAIAQSVRDDADAGKFDGEDGEPGTNGKDGVDGKSGADGKDGYSPVKGVDYWTEDDVASIVSETLAALPTYTGEVAS